jgi:hypothetical protein
MLPHRRRQRSVRIVVAMGLLVAAAGVVLAALLAGGTLWLGGAAVVAWVTGAGASRIVGNELAQARREHARDRAEQAQAYSELAATRTSEQQRFAAMMKQKVEDHAVTITRLKSSLRLAEKRADFAEESAKRNQVAVAKAQQEVAVLRARVAELEADLERARAQAAAEPADAVFDLESLRRLTDDPAVVDLLAWDDRTRTEPRDRRKQA